MTTTKQHEALTSSLYNLIRNGAKENLVIITDQIQCKTFCVAESKNEQYSNGESYMYNQPITGFMNYDKLNHFLLALHLKDRFFN